MEIIRTREDPELHAFIATLESWGLHAKGLAEQVSENNFDLRISRAYDESDLSSSELLQVLPPECMEIDWLDTGEGVRSANLPPKGTDFARDSPYNPVMVFETVRAILAGAGMLGLGFRELKLVKAIDRGVETYEFKPWPKDKGPWWIMESSVTLPQLTGPLSEFDDRDGTFHAPGTHGFRLVEKGFNDVEFHYRRSELQPLGTFDVAQTMHGGPSRSIVVSPRFYRFCREQGFRVGFKPVRIDEE